MSVIGYPFLTSDGRPAWAWASGLHILTLDVDREEFSVATRALIIETGWEREAAYLVKHYEEDCTDVQYSSPCLKRPLHYGNRGVYR